jgi:hypothetical protein
MNEEAVPACARGVTEEGNIISKLRFAVRVKIVSSDVVG